MRKIWMPVLTIVLSAVILLGMYNGLNPMRYDNRDAELLAKMQELLPGSTEFTAETYVGDDANIEFVYKAENGFVVGTRTYGYAGDIAMLVGVHNDGYVTGLQVRDMQETYGLGAEALTDVDFLAQFLYTKGDTVVASNPVAEAEADAETSATTSATNTVAPGEGTEVDAISGATVTSKAIVRSVNSAVAYVTGADVSSAATSWGG